MRRLLALLFTCIGCGATPDAALDGGAIDAPSFCKVPTADDLQDVTGTPAAPYFVHHPALPATQTVLFLPGGQGTRDLALATPQLWLAGATTPDDVRVLLPYSTSNFPAESARALDVLTEAITCYGVDPAPVHLAGTSLGGLAAFTLMLTHAERFASLLGAPGAFQTGGPDQWASALTGKSIFLGFGESDDATWIAAARETYDGLRARGIDTTLVGFPGEGHILTPSFDVTVFYEFWRAPR